MNEFTLRCATRQLHMNLLTDITFSSGGLEVNIHLGGTAPEEVPKLLASKIEVGMHAQQGSIVLLWRFTNSKDRLAPSFVYETAFHRQLLDLGGSAKPVVHHGRLNAKLTFLDDNMKKVGERMVVLPDLATLRFNMACEFQANRKEWAPLLHQLAMMAYTVTFDSAAEAEAKMHFEECQKRSYILNVRHFV